MTSTVTPTPIRTAIPTPPIARHIRSRPYWSVPSGCELLGGCSASASRCSSQRWCRLGVSRMTAPTIPTSRKKIVRTRPTSASLFALSSANASRRRPSGAAGTFSTPARSTTGSLVAI